MTILGSITTETTCPNCGGKGKTIKNKCSNCGGEGRVKKSSLRSRLRSLLDVKMVKASE